MHVNHGSYDQATYVFPDGEMAELAKLLLQPNSLALVAGPGFGKSTLLGHINFTSAGCLEPQGRFFIAAVHLCQFFTKGSLDAKTFIDDMIKSLQKTLYSTNFAKQLQMLEAEAKDHKGSSAFQDDLDGKVTMLCEALQRTTTPPLQNAIGLVLVDGLDEVARHLGKDVSLVSPPTIISLLSSVIQGLPLWLRVVTTSRPVPEILRHYKFLEDTGKIRGEQPYIVAIKWCV